MAAGVGVRSHHAQRFLAVGVPDNQRVLVVETVADIRLNSLRAFCGLGHATFRCGGSVAR